MAESGKPFDRKTLEQAFERLGELARAAEKSVEISVYGGSALVLTTDFRVSTRDVDAVFERDRKFVREAARVIAAEFGWDATWINDGVKGFLSAKDQQKGAKALFRTYPDESGAGLRVFIASPHYIFAMKCLAMRIGGTDNSQDVADIQLLGKKLGIQTSKNAIALVSQYYPAGRISPKTQFGLEEIFGVNGAQTDD